jgi:UPF0755 protein
VSPVQLLLRIILILSIPALIAVGTYLFFRQAFLAPLDPNSTHEVTIEIAPGKAFSEASNSLAEQRVIRYAWSLDILAKTTKADTKIKAGEYLVTAAMSPRTILDKLMSGDVIKRIVTVVPGMSIKDLPALVEAQGLMKAEQFAAALKDPGLLIRAGIASQSFEGYLWPDTYQFSRPIVPWDIIFRMLEEGEKKWIPEFTARSEELRLSRHEILTLASIIEKEAGNLEELPVISSVFHNRLKQGMKLQADPTVIYGLENFDGNLKDEDMKNPHAYNTYVNLGLPPGPICVPGEASIRAALYPSEMPYLYFVSDGAGKHVFSTTFAEHQEAVKRYLQATKDK